MCPCFPIHLHVLKVLANNKGKLLLLVLMSGGYSNLEAERGPIRPQV